MHISHCNIKKALIAKLMAGVSLFGILSSCSSDDQLQILQTRLNAMEIRQQKLQQSFEAARDAQANNAGRSLIYSISPFNVHHEI